MENFWLSQVQRIWESNQRSPAEKNLLLACCGTHQIKIYVSSYLQQQPKDVEQCSSVCCLFHISWSSKSKLSLILLWKVLSDKEDPTDYTGSVDLRGTLCVLTMTPSVERSWKPSASARLYCTLLQWLVTMGGTDALQAAACLNDSLKQTLEKEGSFKTPCFLYSNLVNLIWTKTVWSSEERVKICWSGMWWAAGRNTYLLGTHKLIQDYLSFQTSLEQ